MIKCWGLLFLVFVSFAAKAQMSLRKDILEMTEMSERRIRQTVQDYLGPNTRAVVSVYLKPSAKKSNAGAVGAPNAAEADPSPSLLSSDYFPPNIEVTTLPVDALAIESVEVSIQLEKVVSDAEKKAIETIVKQSVRDFPTTVKVSSTLGDAIKKSEGASERKPASIEPEKGIDQWIKRFGGLVPVVAAVLLLLGLLGLGGLVKASISDLAEGIRSVRGSMSNSGGQKISFAEPLQTNAIENTDAKRPALAPPLPLRALDVRRNLSVVDKYLSEYPLLLVRSLRDDEEDMLGIKFLVSKLSDDAKSKLKNLIGVEKLLKASQFEPSKNVVDYDANGWLQRLIEKIELKKLASGTVVEEALSSDDFLILSAAPPNELFSAALKIGTPEAWRVVSDFLPADFFKHKASDFDDKLWATLMRGSLVSEVAPIKDNTKKIIDLIRLPSSENRVSFKAFRDQEEHFSKVILPSLLNSLLARDLGGDDQFLEFLTAETPQFAKILREHVWTPSRIDEVEDESLRQIFSRLDTERCVYILYAMPERQARRLETFLPAGNAKKIAIDMLSRMKGSVDKDKQHSINALAREFLDYLRTQAMKGEIQLKPSTATNAPREIESEVVVEAGDNGANVNTNSNIAKRKAS